MSHNNLRSRLPKSPGNIFQVNKKLAAEAESRGKKIIRLSIGQPSGPALLSAREAASEAVMSDETSMHEYQDNGSPGVPHFARRFIQKHVNRDLSGLSAECFLPIPGIKPMLALIPLACGASKNGDTMISVRTTTDPGYPTPAHWSELLAGISHQSFHLTPENNFLFSQEDFLVPGINKYVFPNLIMMNYPHNPSGRAANREWLRVVCALAVDNDIRIFNDAAYAKLNYDIDPVTLTDVAGEFPDLSWAEAFSASKTIANGCGWRIGAMVGSPDFIENIARVKGDMDSGFAAFAAAGCLHAVENDEAGMKGVATMYKHRLDVLGHVLSECDMQPAAEPDAGFFGLYKVPKKAFGETVGHGEHFNALMVENTGILGVPFGQYIRYSVTGDIASVAEELVAGFGRAKVSY